MAFTPSPIGTEPPKTIDPDAKCCGNCEHFGPQAPSRRPNAPGGPQYGFCTKEPPVPTVQRYVPGMVQTISGPAQVLDAIVIGCWPSTVWHLGCAAFKKRKGAALELAPHPIANGAIEPLPPPSISGESEPLPAANNEAPLPGERTRNKPRPETKQ